ncbi:MAG: 3-phosphoshikimate 1-carboxyvinyltransferase [Candidatus Omnitrophica bacterium]|nr:3-phosphoshikimate 1-carboxyvinyltransferase [Candidatus Omnitrophota bacterium]
MRKISPASSLSGSLTLGGDKSISHRAIILSSISASHVRIKNFYPSQDCLYTLRAMRSLGVEIRQLKKGLLDISGVGLGGLSASGSIFLGDSGTTYRLLAGLLSGLRCSISLKAGKSLSKRPMRRIIVPLTKMGAVIKGRQGKKFESYPPLNIKGGNLKGIIYKLPVASAQVKSAILLAGLNAKGKTCINEKVSSRDHTERMLKTFGVSVSVKAGNIRLQPPKKELKGPPQITIPGDFSSAAFFIVAALLLNGSRLTIKGVGVNPTRTGLLKVLRRMKANIKVIPLAKNRPDLEPIAEVIIRSSALKATKVSPKEIPSLIDEIPILMVAASFANGTTRIPAVDELRVKETDRIFSMLYNLKRMGVNIRIKKESGKETIYIKGLKRLKAVRLRSFSDHRSAMALVVAACCAEGVSFLDDTSCIRKSFPDFFKALESVKVT